MALSKDFVAALKKHVAKYQDYKDVYVLVPHQRPPVLMDAGISPPDEDDRYVYNDHDASACLPLGSAFEYKGHQEAKVWATALGFLEDAEESWFLERLLCETFIGKKLTNKEFASSSNHLQWDCIWPVIDSDLCITGELSEGDEDMCNYQDEAMILRSDALAAGLGVDDDGFAYNKE